MMCSYQNFSEVNFCSDWEEFWVNPEKNMISCSTSNENNKVQTFEPSAAGTSVILSIPDNQASTSTPYQESSALLSPSSDHSTSPIQNPIYTSTSSYFSTFNPLDQIQEEITYQYPVQNISSSIKISPDGVLSEENTTYSHTPIPRRKRKRTTFTTEQVEALEEVFAKKPYINRDERQILVKKLQLNDKTVKVWFQNRRLKNKREDDNEVIELDGNSNIFERLNAIESKIFERVDEFGFVKLDDKILSELVNVIDDYFTNKANFVEPKRVKYTPIYEPISPASSVENDFCDSEIKCEYQKSNKFNSEDLIDLESIILSM